MSRCVRKAIARRMVWGWGQPAENLVEFPFAFTQARHYLRSGAAS